METIVLPRTGLKDLRFKGELLGAASGRVIAGKEQTRWTDISIYRTESEQYVVAESHITCWQGESNQYTAEVCDVAENVVHCLADNDYGYIMTDAAKEALEEAAEVDPSFRDVMYEDI